MNIFKSLRLLVDMPSKKLIGNGILVGKKIIFPMHCLVDPFCDQLEVLLLTEFDHLDDLSKMTRIFVKHVIPNMDIAIGEIHDIEIIDHTKEFSDILTSKTYPSKTHCIVVSLFPNRSNIVVKKTLNCVLTSTLFDPEDNVNFNHFTGVLHKGLSGSPVLTKRFNDVIGFVLGNSISVPYTFVSIKLNKELVIDKLS